MNDRHIFFLDQVRVELAKRADKVRAHAQQVYMKSSMPYWGVSMPETTKIGSLILKDYVPCDNNEYRTTLLYVFQHAQYREEWYLGMLYAKKFKRFVLPDNIDLFIEIIRLTQWWDIVDEAAAKLVGDALKNVPNRAEILRAYIIDENMWVRRTALLAQLKYKETTDALLLAELIDAVAHEKEFFIRKAIGWVLRQYSYTNPEWVVEFIHNHEDTLSGLSVREGLKALKRSAQKHSVQI